MIRPLDETQYRPVAILNGEAVVEEKNGVWQLAIKQPLAPYLDRVTDALRLGAEQYPERHFAAQRCEITDEWLYVTYGQMYQDVQHLAQALLGLDLSVERPLAILSGNDLHHLRLSLAAMHVGIAYAPISVAYSLASSNYDRLQQVLDIITPGALFVADASQYAQAVAAVNDGSMAVIYTKGELSSKAETYLMADLLKTPIQNVQQHHQAVESDTVAKFLFTSGSTKSPKAVATTHRMLCVNQQMLLQTFPCLGETPPILVDWLPWSHTFGGSHNVGIVLFNGGTLYIDDGVPTETGFKRTLKNLKEISPTTYLTVPKGWDVLADALANDAQLRETFFKNMQFYYFAGAGLSDAVWQKLDKVTADHCGKAIRMMSGLGMTETAPSNLFTIAPMVGAPYVGLPAPGCIAKLVPDNGKLELRIKGPHVMPGYWRNPADTEASFDEEGYFCTGDAVAFVDPNHPELGLYFDGRIAEDFKLSTGTFVSVGPLRSKAVLLGDPYVWDVVVCGLNQDYIGLLVFLRVTELFNMFPHIDASICLDDLCQRPELKQLFSQYLMEMNKGVKGSSKRVQFIRLMTEAPSLDHHEITDKGSLNQRAILQRRADLIQQLFDGTDSERIDYVVDMPTQGRA